jgi:hypothetical protein
MKRVIAFLGFCLGGLAFAGDPPSILNNSAHVVGALMADLTVLGIPYSSTVGPSSSRLAVNQTCPGACDDFVPSSTIIGYATNRLHGEFAANSTTPVTPAVPYQIINQSSSGYTLADYDQLNYLSLETGGIVYSMAYCGKPTPVDYPPVTFVTVLPNNSPVGSAGSFGCAYARGIEFSIPVDHSTCLPSCTWTPIAGGGQIDVSTPSATTEAMTAVLAALKSHHPLWTWGDIKSVLRSTASNWTTGYTAFNPAGPAYGYGNINFTRADSHTGKIYLQPPGLAVRTTPTTAILIVYPFTTSRRAGEVIYAFMTPPAASPPGDEFTYPQIAALVNAHRGVLVYGSNGAGGVQSAIYQPTGKAPIYFAAFTVDDIANLATANYSRIETYSVQRVSF